jgi:hypothetical protein
MFTDSGITQSVHDSGEFKPTSLLKWNKLFAVL